MENERERAREAKAGYIYLNETIREKDQEVSYDKCDIIEMVYG